MVLEEGSFCIPFDQQNSFSFKFQTSREKPPEVRDFDVPIFLSPSTATGYNALVMETSDLLQKKLQPHIDGRKHVKLIARLAGVDVEVARMSL